MSSWRLRSAPEQVADFLRSELAQRRWSRAMPGVHRLAAELGVNRKTADAALRLLEMDGVLQPQGAGKRRIINVPDDSSRSSLRVAILVGDSESRKMDYMVELRHQLREAGHAVFHPLLHKTNLQMNVEHVSRVVNRNVADAWVVTACSREVLEWFSTRATPTFALFGRMRQVRIAGAGPDKVSAISEVTRKLAKLGHRRIVLMVRSRRRLPQPGTVEQAFLDELAAQGLLASDYNLPDWKETVDGFHACLDSLFRTTPPTALIVDEAPLFAAAQQFLARRRLRVPEEVSIVCTDADSSFSWFRPQVTHIRWDSGPLVKRMIRWVSNVSIGKPDLRQLHVPADLVVGGTIGPCPHG
jgi:DNA-binding LacI/PurR family transcriptional regulator